MGQSTLHATQTELCVRNIFPRNAPITVIPQPVALWLLLGQALYVLENYFCASMFISLWRCRVPEIRVRNEAGTEEDEDKDEQGEKDQNKFPLPE